MITPFIVASPRVSESPCLRVWMAATIMLAVFAAQASRAEDDAAIVRVQKPFTIDGSGADWAGIRASQSVNNAREECAEFRLAFDDANFYALVRVSDDSPLKNSANISQELLKRGDAIGFCFSAANGSDKQRILVSRVNGKPLAVAMRPQWPDKKPYSYHTDAAGTVPMDFVAPLDSVRAAFSETASGYVAEIAIPWSELKLRPEDGLRFPFDMQIIFSDTAGSTNSDTQWWHSTGSGPLATQDMATEARLYPDVWGTARLYAKDPGPRRKRRELSEDDQINNGPGVPISFEMPRAAKASLVIRDERGWIVQELLRARPMSKGAHTVYWNGRDRTGQPMPAGAYSYRLGVFDGIKSTFYGSAGNSGRPVFRTEDGNGSEGGTHGGPTAVGAGADGIYLLNSSEEGQKCLRKIDPATGKAKWWASTGVFGNGYAITESGGKAYMVYGPQDGKVMLTRMDAATGQGAPFGAKLPLELGKLRCEGLAVTAGKVFFSEPAKNRLGVIDAASGNTEADISVPAPRGVCVLDAENLLVCSETRIVKVHAPSRKTTPFIEGLAAPRAVAVDKRGEVFVVDLGDSQQIKRYSAQGKLLGTIGKAGGRAATAVPFDPLAFYNPSGIAAGPDGNLWIVENAPPRRFTKLSPDGRWLEDFYGPTGYITVGLDLDDFSSIYYQATQYGPEYVKARVDYDACAKRPGDPVGTWKVEALFNMTQNGIDKNAQPDLMSVTATRPYGKALIFKGTSGKRYFFKPAGEYFALWREENGRWISAAAVRQTKLNNADVVVLWCDTNGDGLVQDAELVRKPAPMGEFSWIDRDLTLHAMNGSWKPARIDERGVPSYDGGAVTPVFAAGTKGLGYYLDQENYGYSASPPAEDGARYFCSNIGAEQSTAFWDRGSETRLMRVKDGRVEWIAGHHDGRLRHDGDNQMIMNIAGELDGVVLTTEVFSNFTAYTSDGLTLGWIATDAKGRTADTGPNAWYVENVQPGLFLKDPKSGKRLLFGASTEDVRVMEISGVFGKDIARTEGKLTLPSALPRSAQTAGQHAIPYSSWAMTQGGRYIGVNGYDWGEWAADVPSLGLYSDKKLEAEIRLRRDAGQLCIYAEALDSDALASIAAYKQSLGDAPGLELMFAPAVINAAKPLAGVTRIFIAVQNTPQGPRASVLACRPGSEPLTISPEFRAVNNRGEFEGPVAKGEIIDFSTRLVAVPGATAAILRRFDERGYRLEVEIPLALFPELTAAATVPIKRQHGVNKTESRRDFSAPLHFNAALWRSRNGAFARLPWVADGLAADPKAANVSGWGMANAQVALAWQDVEGAASYNLYRSKSENPGDAVPAGEKIVETQANDLPGLGSFHYWLAPVDEAGEGQWFGPVRAAGSRVEFPAFALRRAYAVQQLPELSVFPGEVLAVNVAAALQDLQLKAPPELTVKAVARPNNLSALLIASRADARPGQTFSFSVSTKKGNLSQSVQVFVAPVPMHAYGARAHTLANADGRQLVIQSGKPSDIGWQGRGTLEKRSVGSRGYVLFRADKTPALRKIEPPFADTFAKASLGFSDYSLMYSPLRASVDGTQMNVQGWIVTGVGASGSVELRVTGEQLHTITVITSQRFDNGAPSMAFSITDPVSKKTWPLAQFEGPLKVGVLQFTLRGTVLLNVQQTGKGPLDPYDVANIAAIFFD